LDSYSYPEKKPIHIIVPHLRAVVNGFLRIFDLFGRQMLKKGYKTVKLAI